MYFPVGAVLWTVLVLAGMRIRFRHMARQVAVGGRGVAR